MSFVTWLVAPKSDNQQVSLTKIGGVIKACMVFGEEALSICCSQMIYLSD